MNLSLQKRNNVLFGIEGFSRLDRYFASFMCEIASDESSELILASLLASYFTGKGHLCVDIPFLAGKYLNNISDDFFDIAKPVKLPDKERWLDIIKGSGVVGDEDDYKPLILDRKGRLYLYRYFRYERLLAHSIKGRLRTEAEEIDYDLLKRGLRKYFPVDSKQPGWQCIAAVSAVINNFSIISGGPGTGKTTAIVKILALIIEQYLNGGIVPEIALAAPTGKAAGRLKESVIERIEEDIFPDKIKNIIPAETFTLHRLLQPLKNSQHFKYNRDNPLPYNIFIIDESSMIDIALMSKLFQAIPAKAKIILLGDRNQLSSVEAGAVFADLSDAGKKGGYSIPFAERIKSLTETELPSGKITAEKKEMSDTLIEFEKNYRFGSESGIGKISEAVKMGDYEEALNILKSGKYGDIKLAVPDYSKKFYSLLEEPVIKGFNDYFAATDAESLLKELTAFKILSPLRRGVFGVDGINNFVENIFHRKGAINRAWEWYGKRLIMITRNDYRNNLFNGDMGVVLETDKHSSPHVYFMKEGDELKKVSPAYLPEHDTAYAITVHKSQGSEFGKVLLILPDKMYPLLTKELLYTAISRARNYIEIWASENVLVEMIKNPTKRMSGLRDLLT